MSRKCIIEKYLHKARFCGDKTIEVPYNDLTMMCHLALDSLHTSRWIPVSERLPIENGKYLIYVSEHTTEDGVQREEITSAIWSDKKWYYGHSWVPRQKPVTHWMPLPDDCPLQEVE